MRTKETLQIMIDTIDKAIQLIKQQSRLIERSGFSEDPEATDETQREAHQTLKELDTLKSQIEAGAFVPQTIAA